MTVHTALECLALGLVGRHSAFVALFVAIASHKALSALALAASFLKQGATTLQVRQGMQGWVQGRKVKACRVHGWGHVPSRYVWLRRHSSRMSQ